MTKSSKKSASKRAVARQKAAKPAQAAIAGQEQAKANAAGSKQNRIINMLRSPSGTTVSAMMQETEWQQHSVRGFLAGVVRKKLKLKLASEMVNGTRIYRIVGTAGGKASGPRSKRRAA